jgi:hypothetical protein
LLVVALAAGTGSAARGAVCPPVAELGEVSPGLVAVDAEVRLAWIDDHLGPVGARARWWSWGWGGGIGAAGVVQLAVVPFVRPADRIDWYVGAASAAIGVVPFAFFPLAVIRDGRELHAQRRGDRQRPSHQGGPGGGGGGGDDDDGEESCRALADAEARLVRDAKDEAAQQRWWVHVGNVAFNTGVTLFLGLGYNHWLSGIINGASGLVVGEALILTQPTQTIDDLDAYRQGRLLGASMPPLGLSYAVRLE